MKFKMNESEWEIKEISNAEMNLLDNSDKIITFTHGTTEYSTNTIYINADSPCKEKTLVHELTHCYMYEYGHNQFGDKSWNYEDICEICASSHYLIHKICEEYFKKVK